MSKSSCKPTFEQTINLAKKCVNTPSATQQLVLDRPVPPICRPPYANQAAPVQCPNVKHIKVCTGAEMKKKCFQARPCAAPITPPKSAGQKLASLILFGVKAAFAGSLVYMTYEMGLWGNSQSTEQIWKEMCEIFGLSKKREIPEPSLRCKAERELGAMAQPGFPDACSRMMVDTERTVYNLQNTWNKIVTSIFWFFLKGPEELINYVNQQSKKPVQRKASGCERGNK
ncbi:uncharacterized protein LOC108743180 [Agrilus planipennis]|uniref:Uncharacterized protein LOC108743180 n=1 Tax=Agrilus planipennis TaxID=224129 RepID=A0A1W4XP29_AGRPL|nr:uncharacterized protein LOC108743180 [Agrilus planipennis]